MGQANELVQEIVQVGSHWPFSVATRTPPKPKPATRVPVNGNASVPVSGNASVPVNGNTYSPTDWTELTDRAKQEISFAKFEADELQAYTDQRLELVTPMPWEASTDIEDEHRRLLARLADDLF